MTAAAITEHLSLLMIPVVFFEQGQLLVDTLTSKTSCHSFEGHPELTGVRLESSVDPSVTTAGLSRDTWSRANRLQVLKADWLDACPDNRQKKKRTRVDVIHLSLFFLSWYAYLALWT